MNTENFSSDEAVANPNPVKSGNNLVADVKRKKMIYQKKHR